MDDRVKIREALEAKSVAREALAEALGVSGPSVGRLLRCERELKARERDIAFRYLEISDVIEASPARHIPIIGLVAAGAWTDAIQQPLGFAWTGKTGANLFALRVDGDSMNLIAHSGSNVVIDPDDRSLKDGRQYAVMNEFGETTFKTFRNDPARFEPASSNERHKTITIGEEGFTVIGRAVEVSSDL